MKVAKFKGEMTEEMFLEYLKDEHQQRVIDKYWVSRELVRKYKDKLKWSLFSAPQAAGWSDDFYREFKDYIDWDAATSINVISKAVALEFYDKINWRKQLEDCLVTEPVLIAVCDAHPEFLEDWYELIPSALYHYDDFLEKYGDSVDLAGLGSFEHEHILDKYWDSIANKNCIDSYMSLDFIERHYKDMNPRLIAASHAVPESFVEDHFDFFKDSMGAVSSFVVLSDDFIRRHADVLNFKYLAKYQRLSDDIMREFKDKFTIEELGRNQKLPEDLRKEYSGEINPWLYYTDKEKRAIVSKYTKDAYDEFFIAWVGCEEDRVGVSDYAYKFTNGAVLESVTSSEGAHSQGIIVEFDEQNTAASSGALAVPVKVYYRDLSYIYHPEGRSIVWAYCRKVTVMK